MLDGSGRKMKMDEGMEINGGGWRWMKRMEMDEEDGDE